MKQISFFLLLMAILTSCSSGSFKIDGNLTNLKGTTVKVIFSGDSGVVDGWTSVDKKGHFTLEGQASQPVLVSLYDGRGNPLVTLVAVNGDHLKVKGDAGKAMGVKVKGNRLNEDWQLFRDEHAAFYTDPNSSRLDAAIEKYVREHPDDMLSTVLLVADYSNYDDRDKVDRMLKGINSEARPESLARPLLDNRVPGKNSRLPRLMSLKLIKHNGDFEEIKLTDGIDLISLWASPQNDRKMLIDKIQTLDEDVRVIDVLAESDTLRWHKTIADDPESWPHYWAPGGPLEQGIQLLGITSMPWYAVVDSTGMVTYSGPSLKDAMSKAAVKNARVNP